MSSQSSAQGTFNNSHPPSHLYTICRKYSKQFHPYHPHFFNSFESHPKYPPVSRITAGGRWTQAGPTPTPDLGQRPRVPHVLHRHVGGPRQRLEVSLHRLRERRWRLPHPLHHSPAPGRQALLLPRDDRWPIHQPIVRENMGTGPGTPRCRLGPDVLHGGCSHVLLLAHVGDAVLSVCQLPGSVAVVQVYSGVGRDLPRLGWSWECQSREFVEFKKLC